MKLFFCLLFIGSFSFNADAMEDQSRESWQFGSGLKNWEDDIYVQDFTHVEESELLSSLEELEPLVKELAAKICSENILELEQLIQSKPKALIESALKYKMEGGFTLLHYALLPKTNYVNKKLLPNADILDLLLSAGANPNDEIETSTFIDLDCSCFCEFREGVDALSITRGSNSAHLAVLADASAEVLFLLQKSNSNFDHQDALGVTPRKLAVIVNNFEAMQFFAHPELAEHASKAPEENKIFRHIFSTIGNTSLGLGQISYELFSDRVFLSLAALLFFGFQSVG